MCESKKESLSTALSLMSAYGYRGAKTLRLNDIVNEVSAVSVKRSVK